MLLLLPCGRPRAREAAPRSGAPPRDACSAWGKMQFSLPPSPIPLLLSFTFFPSSLSVSHSCCLGDPALVREEATFPHKAQGPGQLPLQDGEGWQWNEHTYPWRLSLPFWFATDMACGALLWVGRCRERRVPRLSYSVVREILKMVNKEGFS